MRAAEGPAVSIVIRTRGNVARREQLERALASVLSQRSVRARAIVVVNGPSFSRELVSQLQAEPRCTVHVDPSADKCAATRIGRALVRDPYFGYLDDDDELLPGALEMRARHLETDPEIDCIATNGEYETRGGVRPVLPNPEAFRAGLCRAILNQRTWLAAGGALFRAATIGERYFSDLPPHREWTLIGFRIASERNVRFVDETTYRIHDTAVSESKKPTYAEVKCEVLRAMESWLTSGELVGRSSGPGPPPTTMPLRTIASPAAFSRPGAFMAGAWPRGAAGATCPIRRSSCSVRGRPRARSAGAEASKAQ